MSIQSELAQEAKCFCFNDATERAVVVYLLLSKTGLLNMTPSQLAIASKAYSYDLDTWKKIVAYLLAVDAGLQGDTPKQLADAAKCYCFDEGTWKKVVAFLLASGGSGGPCPQDMQVAWTPTNLKLGELIGYSAANANIPLDGILSLTFNHSHNSEGYNIVGGANTIQSASFPNLVDVGDVGFQSNGIDFRSCSNLASFSAPALTIIRGAGTGLLLDSDPSLTAISAPLLVTIEGALSLGSDTTLTTISFPSLITIGAGVDCSACSALSTVSFPVWLPTNGTTSTFLGDALTAASVNHILARHVANVAYVSGTVDVSGGTNAAPSGQGIADKATLIGRGCTVNTN